MSESTLQTLAAYVENAAALAKAEEESDDELTDKLTGQQEGLWELLSEQERCSLTHIRPEYVKCVRVGGTASSWCGRDNIVCEFHFVDWEHADTNRARQGRLLTCGACENARGLVAEAPAKEEP